LQGDPAAMIASLDASVFHARLRPRRNAFRYRAFYLALPLSEVRPGKHASMFSIDRPNLFSLKTRDYGDGRGNLSLWIADVLRQWNIPEADGETILVTMPRVFGYTFNPVNFWLCFDRTGGLRAVLSEVNNTFGERHCYLSFHEDRRPIAHNDDIPARKIFHVSPFMDVKGEYRFRFSYSPDRIAIAIDLCDGDGVLLSTSIGGKLEPLNTSRLLRAVTLNPLLPFKVVALIHYQALRLYLKKMRYFRKPLPPATPISQ
jgi:DUF1365 family protein